MKDQTLFFYGLNALQQFENWLLGKSEEVRRKIEKRLNYWLKWYEDNHPDADEKELKKATKRKKTELANAY